MAKRKYTRKQLRQPDEFISISMKVWEAVSDNASRVIVALLVAMVIVAGVWTWSYFSDARAARSTEALTRAFAYYNQTVFPMETKLPPSEDGIPRFKSYPARAAASEKEFTQAMGKASGSLRLLAQLMRAGLRQELGKYDEAIKDYQAYLAAGKLEPLRFNAQEGIGYCHEAQKKWDLALEAFRKLPREGEQRWRAMYHEGRILALKGQKQEAVKLLKQVMEKTSIHTLKEHAADQLALIEQGK